MTLEQWAYLSEVLAAVAVVISLIYLGRQVHQSNVLSRAQTSQNMIQLARHEIEKLEDPDLWFAWTTENISDQAKIKMNAQLTATMRQREFEWLASKNGIIDAEMYRAYSGAIPTIILGTERARRWWKVHGHEHSFAPGFVAHVDKLLQDVEPIGYWDSLSKW